MAKERPPGGHFIAGGSTGQTGTSGESLGMSEGSVLSAPIRQELSSGSQGGFPCGSSGEFAKIPLSVASKTPLVSNVGSLGRVSVGTMGLASGGLPTGAAFGGPSGGQLGFVSGESMIASLGRPPASMCALIGGNLGLGSLGQTSKVTIGTSAGSTTCSVTVTSSGGITAHVPSHCQGPVSTVYNPVSGHSQPLSRPPLVTPLHQLPSLGRTTSGLNLFNSPPNGSPSSTRGPHSHPPLDSSPSSLSHFNLAGLQSGLLPHQISLEKSALASLAQYGSANASPCLTPVAPSPTIQSPVSGRTFLYSDPSSVMGSHSSLFMPQSSLPSQLCNQPHTPGRDSPLGRFSEDLKFLSSSHPSLPQEVAHVGDHQATRSSMDMGYFPSPFSSPTLVPKTCVSVPGGRETPPFQTSPGPSHQTQSPGASPAVPPRRGSAALMPDLEPQTVRSKLPSNL